MIRVMQGTNKEIQEQAIKELHEMFEVFQLPVYAEVKEVLIDEPNWLTFEIQICFGNQRIIRLFYRYIDGGLIEIQNQSKHLAGRNAFEIAQLVYSII
ncbi:hypothetical protein [Bacillus cereus]|uniref:hypothetical protein n=1 Tax=Bacillus cereus TaxID=1396 RepID=UPI0030790677